MTLTFAERVLHAKVIECKWDCTNWGIAYPAGSGQWIVEPVGTREDAQRQLWHRRKQVLPLKRPVLNPRPKPSSVRQTFL